MKNKQPKFEMFQEVLVVNKNTSDAGKRGKILRIEFDNPLKTFYYSIQTINEFCSMINEEYLELVKEDSIKEKLFYHLSNEHSITLLDSELDEIIKICSENKSCEHDFEHIEETTFYEYGRCKKCGEIVEQ